MVLVDITLALICFTGTPGSTELECHNALIGGDTPKGEFTLIQRLTEAPFYGGDVLQFMEEEWETGEVYAIHRVWLGRPHEKREQRLKSKRVKDRKITKGCVNVDPKIYDRLVECCSTDKLIIK